MGGDEGLQANLECLHRMLLEEGRRLMLALVRTAEGSGQSLSRTS
jgi:hypothetical protein